MPVGYFDRLGRADASLSDFSAASRPICFTSGTRILTPRGERLVETLRAGDEVLTRDNGIRPIRWIGTRDVVAEGALAPVLFDRGVIGNADELLVSPQHRMLLSGQRADTAFGTREVLVSAIDLVNGTTVRRASGGTVRYLHLLFDRHEIILANGSWSESFLPSDEALDAVAEAQRAELFALFPELRTRGHAAQRGARRILTAQEARALI